MRPLAALAFLAALVAAACGSDSTDAGDERAVADAVTGYLQAVAAGDGGWACSYLTETAQLGVFEFRFAHVGTDHPDEACAWVVEQRGAGNRGKLLQARVAGVEIEGDDARATIERVEVALARVGDTWRIDELGLAGRVLGEGAPPPQSFSDPRFQEPTAQ